MSNPLPAAVKALLKAKGGVAPVSLIEIQTVNGNRYFWADCETNAPSLLAVVYPTPPILTIGPTGTPIVSHPS